MKCNKLKLIILLVILFGIGIWLNHETPEKTTKIKVALDWTPNTNHTGMYVAQNKGYYRDAGLDVEIIQPSEMATENLVAMNKVDFGVSFMPNLIINNANNDTNLISVLALVGNDQSGFGSKQEKGIKRPKDLENKTYCGSDSAIEHAMIDTMVKEDGGNPSLVNYQTSTVSFENAPSECDFMWIYDGWEGIKAKQDDIAINLLKFSDYLPKQYAPILITSQKYNNENEKIVQKFIDATIKGYEYAINYPEASAEILISENPELKSDQEFIQQSQIKLSSEYKTTEKYGYQTDKVWQDYYDWLEKNDIVPDVNKTYYTNKYVK